ncbi:A/G-specific adenine glycosylase [Robiginitalea aurantiaca]|uniref:Adenine DNA glycosylase n=1 Tax=Robiginitalea aurantiaca TaxID=3056915 RepID=A0ABT7WET9_9FLAO|nr:A/G-specific adenine glycosylase [Robiginitalea aurantiaca]MDM9631329.1 A/G-specific adenine glycosylase [Robiginitalea aurantiaca]
MDFSDRILSWYAQNKRDLPWRKTRDPYNVWLSEIIMQQTRVAQGLPYYLRFIERFPEVADLARASEEEVLKTWQGLGYYSRARNLHATAQRVATDYQGTFPATYKELMDLKGVGPYTAAAIGSICFDLLTPVVDGNVYRVLSRYFGVELPVNSGEGSRYIADLAGQVMSKESPGNYNQALMEFGALQCIPRNPDCLACPLSDSCVALAKKKVSQLPVKLPKKAVRKRYFNYFMPVDPDFQTLLIKRKDKGIWRGLYEFPLLESELELPDEKAEAQILEGVFTQLNEPLKFVKCNPIPLVHKLSHQHLFVTFRILYLGHGLRGGVPITKMQSYPVPIPIANFMETVKNSYF